MVGATTTDFKALLPVFEAYCENVVHAGPPGHGLVLKVCTTVCHVFAYRPRANLAPTLPHPPHPSPSQLINNFIGQAITTATAEGLVTAAKTGLDIRALFRVLSSGSVDNKMMSFMIQPMLDAEGDAKRERRIFFNVSYLSCSHLPPPCTSVSGLQFSLSNAMKDLRAYTHLTESLCLPSPVGEAVHQSLVTANCLGLGDKYIASLITAQEKLTGVKIVPDDGKA